MVTALHEHAQNGAAEVTVKIFKEDIMKRLHSANLPMAWWGDSAHNFNDCRILGPCPAKPEISIAEA